MSNCLSPGVGKFSIIFSINYSYINSHFHFTKKKKNKKTKKQKKQNKNKKTKKQNKTKNKKQKQNKTKNQKSKPINLVQVQQTTPQRKQSFSLN